MIDWVHDYPLEVCSLRKRKGSERFPVIVYKQWHFQSSMDVLWHLID